VVGGAGSPLTKVERLEPPTSLYMPESGTLEPGLIVGLGIFLLFELTLMSINVINLDKRAPVRIMRY
jgi:hypothetical protein